MQRPGRDRLRHRAAGDGGRVLRPVGDVRLPGAGAVVGGEAGAGGGGCRQVDLLGGGVRMGLPGEDKSTSMGLLLWRVP